MENIKKNKRCCMCLCPEFRILQKITKESFNDGRHIFFEDDRGNIHAYEIVFFERFQKYLKGEDEVGYIV
jgi:hypothetical protein